MVLFKIRSNEKKSGVTTRNNKWIPLPDGDGKDTPATDSETDPTTTESDSSHATPRRTGSTRKSRTHASSRMDNLESSGSEKDNDQKEKEHRSKSSSSRSRKSHRSKRRSKRSSTPTPSLPPTSEGLPYESSHQEQMTPHDTNTTHPINPFANKGEVYLCQDMALVADAMNLDWNTRVMLAYYDAKTLEDFCLLAESDLKDLVARAQAMRRTIPPLQLRKIQVLREWVQEISSSQDESRLPGWIKLTQKKSKRKSKKIIPEDWKTQFTRDLPRLKHQLKKKGADLSTFSFSYFAPSLQSISMCGLVQ